VGAALGQHLATLSAEGHSVPDHVTLASLPVPVGVLLGVRRAICVEGSGLQRDVPHLTFPTRIAPFLGASCTTADVALMASCLRMASTLSPTRRLPSLIMLDDCRFRHVSHDAVSALATSCPGLTGLSLRGQRGLSRATVSRILAALARRAGRDHQTPTSTGLVQWLWLERFALPVRHILHGGRARFRHPTDATPDGHPTPPGPEAADDGVVLIPAPRAAPCGFLPSDCVTWMEPPAATATATTTTTATATATATATTTATATATATGHSSEQPHSGGNSATQQPTGARLLSVRVGTAKRRFMVVSRPRAGGVSRFHRTEPLRLGAGTLGGLVDLAAATPYGRLMSLDLRGQARGGAWLAARVSAMLGTPGAAAALTHLDLGDTRLGNSGCAELVAALRHHQPPVLCSLALAGCGMWTETGVLVARYLAHNASVTSLDLSRNPIGDEALAALGHCLHTANATVTHLRLASVRATPMGMGALAGCLVAQRKGRPALVHLDVSGNPASAVGVDWAAKLRTQSCRYNCHLDHLVLRRWPIPINILQASYRLRWVKPAGHPTVALPEGVRDREEVEEENRRGYVDPFEYVGGGVACAAHVKGPHHPWLPLALRWCGCVERNTSTRPTCSLYPRGCAVVTTHLLLRLHDTVMPLGTAQSSGKTLGAAASWTALTKA